MVPSWIIWRRGAPRSPCSERSDGSTADPAEVAASHDLLLLSSSIQNLDTAARYAQTTTPLIFWEPRRLLEATQLARWGGTAARSKLYIRIVDAEHPITAGLPVEQRLRVVRRPDTFSVAWPFQRARGASVGEASVRWRLGNPGGGGGRRAIEWATGTGPDRLLYWHHDTFRRSTGEAVRLFDRAVDWALGLPAADGA